MTSQEYNYEIKIPKERIAVLIGKKGEIKKRLEKTTGTRLRVDSEEGDVGLNGSDPLNLMTAKDIIQAIARGFNPEVAFLLLKSDYMLEVLSLQGFANTPKALLRIKGRVIGSDGKSRRIIEELTEAYISVYGKTIALIGDVDALNLARKAVEMLLSGSPHRNVYKWLEKQRRLKNIQEW